MASLLFSKLVVAILFIMVVTMQFSHVLAEDEADFYLEALKHEKNPFIIKEYKKKLEHLLAERCPEEGMLFYKECKGNLQTCSPCISEAERKCRQAVGPVGRNGGNCGACSTIAGTRCNEYKVRCANVHDCGRADEYRCVNSACVPIRQRE